MILALAIVCTSSINVFAQSSLVKTNEMQANSVNAVNVLMQETGRSNTADKAYPLYDANNEITAYYVTMQPTGYAIVDMSQRIVEYSPSGSIDFPEGIIYYFGAGQYFTKTNGVYSHIYTNYTQTQENARKLTSNFKQRGIKDKLLEKSTNGVSVQSSSYYEHYSLPGNTRRYNNTTGICGTVAAVILLMYYRDHIDSFMVPSWHDTSTGQSLINLLYPQIEIYNPGSSHASLINGLNYYFRWRGISGQYSASAKTLSKTSYVDYIKVKKRPVLIGIGSISHMAVGTGYEYLHYNGTSYAIVNEGWGKANDGYYLWSELDFMAALNK